VLEFPSIVGLAESIMAFPLRSLIVKLATEFRVEYFARVFDVFNRFKRVYRLLKQFVRSWRLWKGLNAGFRYIRYRWFIRLR
jgi:hypothetical protein